MFAAVDTVALIFMAEDDERKVPLSLPLCESQGFQITSHFLARRDCGEAFKHTSRLKQQQLL